MIANNITVLVGDGTGDFVGATKHAAGQMPISIEPGDFNRDGHADLVVGLHNGNGVAVLLSQSK